MYRIQIHLHGNIVDEFDLECSPARLLWELSSALEARYKHPYVGRSPKRPYVVGDIFSVNLDGVPAAAVLTAVPSVVTGE